MCLYMFKVRGISISDRIGCNIPQALSQTVFFLAGLRVLPAGNLKILLKIPLFDWNINIMPPLMPIYALS